MTTEVFVSNHIEVVVVGEMEPRLEQKAAVHTSAETKQKVVFFANSIRPDPAPLEIGQRRAQPQVSEENRLVAIFRSEQGVDVD